MATKDKASPTGAKDEVRADVKEATGAVKEEADVSPAIKAAGSEAVVVSESTTVRARNKSTTLLPLADGAFPPGTIRNISRADFEKYSKLRMVVAVG